MKPPGLTICADIVDWLHTSRVQYTGMTHKRVQGIYALSQRLEHYVDLKIAIRGGVHFDLVKRV